ncbi:MAG: hypothetical protein U5K00_15030 [Melioribacteraceae bacterium]|nr:hypothetical protein [Melioribacteraceae bacterium]
MKSVIIVLITLFLINCTEKEIIEKANYPKYDLQLELDPAGRYLSVEGNLKFNSIYGTLDTLILYLHKQLRISSFSINGFDNFRVDTTKSDIRFLPEAKKVLLIPGKPINKGDKIDVNFVYQGRITEYPSWSANVIDTNWSELGLYFPWFPFNMDLRPFNYELEVKVPSEYKVFAMGESTRQRNLLKITTKQPTNDLVLCASKKMKIEETGIEGNKISIVHNDISSEIVDSVFLDVKKIYSNYNEWFGIKEGDMALVQSQREQGGGYARTGGLFLAGFDGERYLSVREGYMRYIGHELAHIWWNKANSNTWEDWLNEKLRRIQRIDADKKLIRQK